MKKTLNGSELRTFQGDLNLKEDVIIFDKMIENKEILQIEETARGFLVEVIDKEEWEKELNKFNKSSNRRG